MAAPKKKKSPKKKKIIRSPGKRPLKKSPPLKRFKGNPIITPDEESNWQSRAAFNAAAMINDGKVHIIYRAVGNDDLSTFGYAASEDGMNISERLNMPVYAHKNKSTEATTSAPLINYLSGGGGNGGSEDPRITSIDGKVYMLYTAFDGWGSVRISLTSIKLEDFLNKKWNWKEPVMISPPDQIHKNWVLFPQKIGRKYAILHGISPKIMIDYVDDLDKFDGKTFIESIHGWHPLWQSRDKNIRGVGPTPLKTKLGWLILYHAMEPHETHRYKLWAMILDLKDPTKILYRSKKPILEPDAIYENVGAKAGVIYSCGAVIKGKNLFVYYGGADTVTCIATANLQNFLDELKKTGKVKLIKKK